MDQVLVVSVVTVGDTLNSEDDVLDRIWALNRGIKPPKAAYDGSAYLSRYEITINDEPLNVSEYCTRIACGTSTHVF